MLSPPSRGKWRLGVSGPSTRSETDRALASAFTAGLGIGFKSGFGAAGSLDFNDFDAGLWDSWVEALLAAVPDFLASFLATALRALVTGVLTAAFKAPRVSFAGVVF